MDRPVDSLPRVSVVVPVYNTENDRLFACINSLERQTSPAFELILVDDGSHDAGCLMALDEIEREHAALRVIHIAHQGVSIARNTGAAHSKGDYILFVDSDDCIPPHMIERGQRVIAESGCDVVMGYVQQISDTNPPIEFDTDHPKWAICDARDMLAYHLKGSSNSVQSHLAKGITLKIGPVARLVKSELAKSISFPAGVRISEDTLWSLLLFLNAEKIAVVEDNWYWYYRSSQSASSGIHPSAADDARVFLNALDEIVSSNADRLPNDAVLARVLGEISRVAKTWYSYPECNMSYRDCTNEMNGLLDSYQSEGIVELGTALSGGPILLIKYLFCRSGLFIPYWKMRLRRKQRKERYSR